MRTIKKGVHNTRILIACFALFVSLAGRNASAQPPFPVIPDMIGYWTFDDTNWASDWTLEPPMSFTNLNSVPSWSYNALQVDSANAAWLQYHVIEPDGFTNLICSNGAVELWFNPDWAGTNMGGTGPGNWAMLIDAGAWTSNSSYGWWSLYVNPAGTGIYFSGQTNTGLGADYLSAPIAWNSNEWHHILLNYSPTNSQLYLDGELATNGTGVTYYPGPDVLTNGFFVGSDCIGQSQCRGQIEDLMTYDGQFDSNGVYGEYAGYVWGGFVYPLPDSGGGGDFVSIGGGLGMAFSMDSGEFGLESASFNSLGSNVFWLEVLKLGTNSYNTNTNSVTLLLHGTIPDIVYQLQSATNLNPTNTIWTVEQNLIGVENTNFTAATVSRTGRKTVFFRALAYTLDSDGDGLPDWWELQYGFDPNNPDTGNTGIPDGYKQDSAGDGYNNQEKYQMGIPPGTWVTPRAPSGLNAILNSNGTSATLTWNPSPGNVESYTIFVQDDQNFEGFVELTNLPASQTSYTDDSSIFSDGIQYEIQTDYAGGSSSADNVPFQTTTLTACLVHGPDRGMYLALITIPQGTTGIFLSLVPNNACGWGNGNTITETIPISSFTNGLCALSEAQYPLYTAYTVNAKAVTPTSQNDLPVIIESDCDRTIRYPFLDASQVLKDNLIFNLQFQSGIPANTNFSPVILVQSEGIGFGARSGYASIVPVYAFASFHPVSLGLEFSPPGNPIYSSDALPLHPWEVNTAVNNFVYQMPTPSCWNATNFSTSGGEGRIDVYQVFSFSGQFSFDSPDFALNQVTNPCPSVLPPPTGRAIANQDPLSPITFDPITGAPRSPRASMVNASPNAFGIVTQGSYLDYDDTNFIEHTNFFTPGASAADFVLNCWEQYVAPSLQPQIYQFTTRGNIASLSPDTVGLNNGVPVTNLLIAGVGDPSFTVNAWLRYHLLNGSAGIYGYVEQYFDTAYKIDTNGIVTTNQTGVLSPYGYFFPTEPGPVALITRTNIENGQRGTGVVQVIRLAVDANHDGNMDLTFAGPDNTSADRPFKFWVNNDSDKTSFVGDPGEDTPAITNSQYDYNFPTIPSQRDLEDWARLWLCGVPALATNQGYTVTLSISAQSGNPAINLVDAIETNGGTLYLTDTNAATAQTYDSSGRNRSKYPTISSGSPLTLSASLFTNAGNKYFLFEGAGIGQGELVMTISRNGTNIASTSVFMNLLDVKDMFEHADAENVTAGVPPSSLVSRMVVDSLLPADPTEAKQMIVFVHGINNTPWDAESSGETMFKRLYWQGYQGRFAAFRWPCAYLPPNTANPFQYNKGEFYAWKSASAFKDYLTYLRNNTNRLPDYKINIIAHSQGNVVASEAIAQGAPFDNYILTQGAIPAHCYDANTNDVPFLQKFLDAEAITPTPLYPTNGGYHGYFTSTIIGNLIDFYNTNDFALASGVTTIAGIPIQTNWEEDQRTQKPEAFLGGPSYIYTASNLTSVAYYTFGSHYTVTDPQELKSMVARSRSHAIGAQNGANGVISSSIDLIANFGFDKTRPEHSAQFTRPIQTCLPYYRQVLTSFQILP